MLYNNELNALAYQYNFESATVLSKICEPLFRNFNLTHFGYLKLLPNKMLRITTGQLWTKKYFELNFYNDSNLYKVGNIPINQKSFYICSEIPGDRHLTLPRIMSPLLS